jgi:hypothetical protein
MVFYFMPLSSKLYFIGYFMTNRRGKSHVGFRPALTLLEDRLVPAGRPLPFPVIAAGTDAGVPAQARLIDADTGSLLVDKSPLGPGYT